MKRVLIVASLILAASLLAFQGPEPKFSNKDFKGSYAFSLQGQVIQDGQTIFAAATGRIVADGAGVITEVLEG